MSISLQYQTIETCHSVSGNLGSDILLQLRLLNDRYNRDLCQFEHGVDDVRCSQASISVTCIEENKADISIVLPWIRYVRLSRKENINELASCEYIQGQLVWKQGPILTTGSNPTNMSKIVQLGLIPQQDLKFTYTLKSITGSNLRAF